MRERRESGGSATRLVAAAVVALSLSSMACTGDSQTSSAPSTTPQLCGVSDLLVPDCGVWFGATTPSADGSYDYTRGLDEYEAVVGRSPAVLRFYRTGGRQFPTEEHIALSERPGRSRSILFFSWKPAPELTWRQIAAGAADGSIASVAEGLNAYPRRLFFAIHHEPENEVSTDPTSGMTTSDYVAMYRHVATRLRDLDVNNAVYVMTYMGFERWAPIVDELYPGDDVVDWIGYDPYGFADTQTFGALLNDPRGSDWPGFYRWVTDRFPGKPIMVAEWGFDLSARPDASSVIEDAPETLSKDFPAIKALIYWNDHNDKIDGRLTRDDPVWARFADAYRRLAEDPLFSLTPTDRAP